MSVKKGKKAEHIAARFLKKHGLDIKVMNYRCFGGEIDMVCFDDETLVFVEVKYRDLHALVSPLTSIDTKKKKRVRHAAKMYLQQHASHDVAVRFDALSVQPSRSKIGRFFRRYDVEHVRNAF